MTFTEPCLHNQAHFSHFILFKALVIESCVARLFSYHYMIMQNSLSDSVLVFVHEIKYNL